MDRLWGALAGILTAASILTLWLGAWGWSFALGFLGGGIFALLSECDEVYMTLGPVRFLRVGKVWAFDVGSRGIWGVGLNPRCVRLRRVKVD